MSGKPQCNLCRIPVFQPVILPQLTQKAELRQLVRCNEYPTDVQASHCQEIISSSPTELERYDTEIARLRATIDKLEKDRTIVEDYLRLCRYTVSPIRRMPAEILTEIFAFFVPDAFGTLDTSMQYEEQVKEELARVANADLLRVAQVCLRWHKLAMETPSLWSNIGLHLKLWGDGLSRGRMMTALRSSLERGGDFPLDLGIKIRDLYGHGASDLIPLLTQYSRRWRKLSLSIHLVSHDGPSSGMLSTVQGCLPLLETLNIETQNLPETTGKEVASYFAVAPRLTQLWYRGRLPALSKLPLEQLEVFVYHDVPAWEMDDLISSMARFSNPKCQCEIQVRVDIGNFSTAIDLSPVESRMSVLGLSGAGIYKSDSANPMLGRFVTRLTLPFLAGLQIICRRDQRFPLSWPHREFLALAHRSSFHAHLKSLGLEAALITVAELLETLSGLPLLQDLIISDHRALDHGGEEVTLVTNSLLERLTWTPDSTCLVPELSFLSIITLLKFDDTVLRAFVLSRLKPGRNTEGPFEVEVRWWPEHYRNLDPEMITQFTELQSQGELLFLTSESDVFPSLNNDT